MRKEPSMVIVAVQVFEGNMKFILSFSKTKHFRIFNEKTGLLEFNLLGLISAGVKDVDVYTFIANNEVVTRDVLFKVEKPVYSCKLKS